MATEAQPATQAKRILVVEDEVMIRMLLEDMLGELGYTVAAEAACIDEALEATKNADFDLAILDANLNGQPVSPVADALVARGTPFVFATGYGELAEPYRDRPTLKKPFQMDGLKQMLQSALDRGSQSLLPRGGALSRIHAALPQAEAAIAAPHPGPILRSPLVRGHSKCASLHTTALTALTLIASSALATAAEVRVLTVGSTQVAAK